MRVSEAISILMDWTKSEGLLLHAAVVGNSMKHYARYWKEDEEEYEATGILHDMDYEKFPTDENHPYKGVEFLRERGVKEEILQAILGHASYTQTPRETRMAKTLYAVDELSGFITAVCYVTYPQKPKIKSVKKKLKDKNFAAKINREEIETGISQLEIEREEHIQLVIEAVWKIFSEYKEKNKIF